MNAWPKVKLGEVLVRAERAEAPLTGKTYRQIGVKLWGEGAYQRESIDGSQTKYAQLFRAEEGDVIVNKIWARNGSVAVVSKLLSGCFGSGEFPMFSPNKELLDARWIHWLTKTPGFWAQCAEKSQGSSGKNRIKPEQFLNVEIPLPPLAEQRRVVSRIEELSAQIQEARSLRQQAIEEGEAMLIAMAHRADLAATEKEKRGWQKYLLKDVIKLVSDPSRVELNKSYPNIGIYSFGRGLFIKPPINGCSTSAKTLYKIKQRQFIYSRLFAFEGAYGMVTENFDSAFVSNEYPSFECNHDKVLPEFLVAFFKPPFIWKSVAHGSHGLGDRRQRVQPNQILSFEIWLPPISEQRKIREISSHVDTLKHLQAETAAELDALLPAILDRAFSGQLLPQESISVRTKPRSAIVAQKYFIQLIPALLREIKRPITLSRLNAAISLLFLPDQLIPLIESAAGKQAAEHFKAFSQPNEAGAFKAALERLTKAGTIIPSQAKADDSPTLRLNLSHLPPIASYIAWDAHYLATIIDLVPASTPTNEIPTRKSRLKQQTSFV